MQHTQTHRKDTQQSKLQQHQLYQPQYQNQSALAKSILPHERNNKVILHQPSSTATSIHFSSHPAQDTISGCLPERHVGSESPASFSSASVMDSASSSDDEDDDDDDAQYYHRDGHAHWTDHPYRQLSVADMCNPVVAQQSLKIEQLTSDEVEVIQAFGKLRQATC